MPTPGVGRRQFTSKPKAAFRWRTYSQLEKRRETYSSGHPPSRGMRNGGHADRDRLPRATRGLGGPMCQTPAIPPTCSTLFGPPGRRRAQASVRSARAFMLGLAHEHAPAQTDDRAGIPRLGGTAGGVGRRTHLPANSQPRPIAGKVSAG